MVTIFGHNEINLMMKKDFLYYSNVYQSHIVCVKHLHSNSVRMLDKNPLNDGMFLKTSFNRFFFIGYLEDKCVYWYGKLGQSVPKYTFKFHNMSIRMDIYDNEKLKILKYET